MTENKRFTYFKSKIGFGKQGIDDNLKGYTFDFTMDNVLDCMNDLSEENEQLKIRFNEEREKSLKFCRNIDTLTIENEHLKNHIQELQNHLKRLENENEQIKQVIKEAYETERTHIGKSVLKQLLNNIGEI